MRVSASSDPSCTSDHVWNCRPIVSSTVWLQMCGDVGDPARIRVLALSELLSLQIDDVAQKASQNERPNEYGSITNPLVCSTGFMITISNSRTTIPIS